VSKGTYGIGLDPPLDELTDGIYGPNPVTEFGLKAVLASYTLAISVSVLAVTALVHGSVAFMGVLAVIAVAALADVLLLRRHNRRHAEAEAETV
jgi:hypothetical protein